MAKSVIPKRMEFTIHYDLSVPVSTAMPERIRAWMSSNSIDHATVQITEEQDWDIAPMRKFFHGVVLPAYVGQYNDTHSRDSHKTFSRDFVKLFLKAKFIGWVKNNTYKLWEKPLCLSDKPSDILDFCEIMKAISSMKDPVEICSTADLSPEAYWKFINACEAYYHELFQEMYDTRQKPQAPKI